MQVSGSKIKIFFFRKVAELLIRDNPIDIKIERHLPHSTLFYACLYDKVSLVKSILQETNGSEVNLCEDNHQYFSLHFPPTILKYDNICYQIN